MFDARLRSIVDPILAPLAGAISKTKISANLITILGLMPALAAAYAIAHDAFWTALALIMCNRMIDGLDGLVARTNGPTAFGGYLDILADFTFYVSIPIGFGFFAPENLIAAMLLIAAFTLTGISFLAYAAAASHAGISSDEHGPKAFLYSTGIMEGGETIAFFIAFCIFPTHFVTLATIFAALCILTVLQRSILAFKTLN